MNSLVFPDPDRSSARDDHVRPIGTYDRQFDRAGDLQACTRELGARRDGSGPANRRMAEDPTLKRRELVCYR